MQRKAYNRAPDAEETITVTVTVTSTTIPAWCLPYANSAFPPAASMSAIPVVPPVIVNSMGPVVSRPTIATVSAYSVTGMAPGVPPVLANATGGVTQGPIQTTNITNSTSTETARTTAKPSISASASSSEAPTFKSAAEKNGFNGLFMATLVAVGGLLL